MTTVNNTDAMMTTVNNTDAMMTTVRIHWGSMSPVWTLLLLLLLVNNTDADINNNNNNIVVFGIFKAKKTIELLRNSNVLLIDQSRMKEYEEYPGN